MKQIAWGVIGAGGIADRRSIPGILRVPEARFIGFTETDTARAAQLAAKYTDAKAHASMQSLLDDPAVQAVYIATPVHQHLEQIKAAAERGKHILVEKPIALNVAQAEEALAYCEKKDVRLGVGLMMRFSALHQEMKRLMAAGRLGDLVAARAQFSCWYPDMPGAWRQDPALSGGGALIDLGVHSADLLEYIGGFKARSVIASVGTQTFKYQSEDSATLILELENGARAVCESHFNIPDAAGFSPLEFYGTGGSLMARGTLSQDDTGTAVLCAADPSAAYDASQQRGEIKTTPLQGSFGNLYEREFASFTRALLKGDEIEVPGRDGLHLQRLIAAAYKSARDGRKVQI